MLNGIRTLMSVDALSARVAELEAENKRLRDEYSNQLLNQTNFHQVKSPLKLDFELRDYIINCAARRFENVMDAQLLTLAREAAKNGLPRGGIGSPNFYTDVAIADMRDIEVEITLPEVRCNFRVAGAFR